MKKTPVTPNTKREKLANGGKLFVAILLLILIIPTTGMVWVKDGRQSPAYCGSCHQDPYYTSWETDTPAESESYALARRHAKAGVACQSCHYRTTGRAVTEAVNYLTGNYYYPFEEQQLPMDTCFTCHESYDNLKALTSTKVTGEERNPHAGHWGDLECYECHKMHRDSFDYCGQCHEANELPGWTTKAATE